MKLSELFLSIKELEKKKKDLMADTGGGGGGAGAGAGASAGGGSSAGTGTGASSGTASGSTSSSGDSGSAGSGDTGSADSTPSDAPSMDAPVSRGYAFLGSMVPGKKKKKKKKNKSFKYGKGVYENLNDYVMDLEFALKEVVNITKTIKYADMHMQIISEVEALAEKYGVVINEYDINQVYKAKNNLESKIFELEQAFKDKYREVKSKRDDENI